jgi:hypothetical protein
MLMLALEKDAHLANTPVTAAMGGSEKNPKGHDEELPKLAFKRCVELAGLVRLPVVELPVGATAPLLKAE